MIPFWLWSYVLAGVGILGIYLAGKKNRSGWAVGIGAQVLWLSYAVATDQLGFLLTAFAYGAVYVKNYIAWGRES